MTGLDKFWYSIRGWYSCTSWIITEIVKEYLPDLVFWKPPTHPDDFTWYAERVNGRLAMLGKRCACGFTTLISAAMS
jgi:hypothetical protein